MSDILQIMESHCAADPEWNRDCCVAADEIKRLRAELEQVTKEKQRITTQKVVDALRIIKVAKGFKYEVVTCARCAELEQVKEKHDAIMEIWPEILAHITRQSRSMNVEAIALLIKLRERELLE